MSLFLGLGWLGSSTLWEGALQTLQSWLRRSEYLEINSSSCLRSNSNETSGRTFWTCGARLWRNHALFEARIASRAAFLLLRFHLLWSCLSLDLWNSLFCSTLLLRSRWAICPPSTLYEEFRISSSSFRTLNYLLSQRWLRESLVFEMELR